MKLLADVNVSRRAVEELRSRGFDVTRVTDFMDPRADDRDIMDAARQMGSSLVSHDQDFSALLAVTGATSPSLINLRLSNVDVHHLASIIAAVVESAAVDLSEGAIVTVDDSGVRIHRLPIS